MFLKCSIIAQGQVETQLQKAFEFQNNKDYKSAIGEYLSFLVTDTFEQRKPMIFWRIGNCYKELDNKEAAKNYIRTAINFGQFDFGYSKRRYSITLADYFLKEKAYDSALYYLKHAASFKSIRNMCGSNNIYLRTPFYHRMMLAYDGLGLVDSAINCFLPYAFQGTEFSAKHFAVDDYHCKMMDFLHILQKKYSYCDISSDVRKFTDTSNYNPLKVFEHNSCIYKMNFSLKLRDYTYNLYGWDEHCYNLDTNREAIRKDLLEAATREIKNSFIYQYFLEEIIL
jgi:tetratricopeptide (TPR) repeat protein